MIRINILPPEAVVKEKLPVAVFIAFGFGVAIIIVLCLYVRQWFVYKSIESELTRVETQLSQLQDVLNRLEQLKRDKQTLEVQFNAINGLVKNRLFYPQFMEELVSQIPSNLWLSQIIIRQAGDMLEISVDGTAFDTYAIADFIGSLESRTTFSNVELGTIQRSTFAGGGPTTPGQAQRVLLDFRLIFKYKQ